MIDEIGSGSDASFGAHRQTQFQVQVEPATLDAGVAGAAVDAHPAAVDSHVQFHTHVVGAVGTAGVGAGVTPLLVEAFSGAAAAGETGSALGAATLVWDTDPSLPGLKILMLTFTLLGTACAAAAIASPFAGAAASCSAGVAAATGTGAPPCGRSALSVPAAGTVAPVASGATAREASGTAGGLCMASGVKSVSMAAGTDCISPVVLLILLSAAGRGAALGLASGPSGGCDCGADAAVTVVAAAAAPSIMSTACGAPAATEPP